MFRIGFGRIPQNFLPISPVRPMRALCEESDFEDGTMSSVDRQPEILSLEQALEILPGFTKWGLYNMIRRRQIPYRRRGRKNIFLKSELIKWVESLPGVSVEEVLRNNGHPSRSVCGTFRLHNFSAPVP